MERPTIQTKTAYDEALQCLEDAFDCNDWEISGAEELLVLVMEYEAYHKWPY